MFEGIPSWVVTDLSPWSIVGLMCLGLMTGRVIVPRFYYKELLADRDRWRSVAETQTAAVAVFADAMPGLVEVGKTTDKIMTAIQEKTETETAR
jgi:hypothetical protein